MAYVTGFQFHFYHLITCKSSVFIYIHIPFLIQNSEIAVVMDLDLAEKGTANDEENSTVEDISYQQVKTRYSYGIASNNLIG